MVGNANGRSIIASTIRLPAKSSRTSTQAISKPNTRLMTVTAVEIVSVTRNDSIAACDETASQKARQPPPAACQTMAASGNSTITESHTTAIPTRTEGGARGAGKARAELRRAAFADQRFRHPVARR